MDYPGQRVLERVNLEVPSGQFVLIVGASGCGKSTFLRLILSQEKPTRGTILLDGKKLPDDPGPDRGVVFQRYSGSFLIPPVVKNVVLASSRRTDAADRRAGRSGTPDRTMTTVLTPVRLTIAKTKNIATPWT
jgi:ABC-type nitrate/sulfonate/bicarbonate transport system ATPase subunit